jgi:hypothetical protein
MEAFPQRMRGHSAHRRRPLPEPVAAAPRRVQVEGDLFHGRVPAGAAYVGRATPGLPASPYANPFPVRRHGRDAVIQLFYDHVAAHPGLAAAIRRDLAGRDLAFWCPLSAACHGDVLLELANRPQASDG